MSNKEYLHELLIVILLVIMGILLRIAFADWPNVAPTAAFALYAGSRNKNLFLGLLVPLSITAFSDLYFGGYSLVVMSAVYVAMALPLMIGKLFHQLKTDQAIWSGYFYNSVILLLSSLCGSLGFFLITNFAVWFNGGLSSFQSMYPLTLSGLIRCYTNAIPFFRFTIIGDLCFCFVTFGIAAVVTYFLRTFANSTQSELSKSRQS